MEERSTHCPLEEEIRKFLLFIHSTIMNYKHHIHVYIKRFTKIKLKDKINHQNSNLILFKLNLIVIIQVETWNYPIK